MHFDTGFSRFFLTFGLVLAAAGMVPAEAKTPFDGPWAVTIMTTSGSCDPAYRYAVTVSDGTIANDMRESSGIVAVSGKVDNGGSVKVNVSRGDQQANGSGKLSGAAGGGTWSGKSASTVCSGRWEAKRN